MPIIIAALGERVAVCRIRPRIEHCRLTAVAGHAIALKIGDMARERRSAETRPP